MFEYKVEYVQNHVEIEGILNGHAAKGFSVIDISHPQGRYLIIMEREIPVNKEPKKVPEDEPDLVVTVE